jgi:hypothetical protein
MNAIDNSNLLDYRGTEGTSEFIPALAYDYDATAAEIDFTDTTTFPSGVALKKTKIQVFDKFGGEVRGALGPATGSDSGNQTATTIDVSDLDRSKPLDIKATIIADDDMLVADGIATNISDGTGNLGSWDKQKNAITINPAP